MTKLQMIERRRLTIPQRKLVMRSGKLAMPYIHQVNYKSAYDFDKVTTTQFEE